MTWPQIALDDALSFLAILNPFALALYLSSLMDDLEPRVFTRVFMWASFLSFCAFAVFAFFGEWIFVDFFHVQPEALRVFGGIVIGIVAYNYVTRGFKAMETLRGSLEELPSAIAVPFMVGAGTITQSIFIGRRHTALLSAAILLCGVIVSLSIVFLFKFLRQHMRRSYEQVFDRYVNIVSRLNGLLVGAVAMDMIVRGVRDLWSG